jgi:hypothetical protein
VTSPASRSDAPVLAIDTALQRAVVALGALDGRLLDEEAWVAGHRHGEELLPRVHGLLERNGVGLTDLAGIVVGTGPGAFTGLRVGIATAKALAHGLGVPLVGVSTADALLAGAPSSRSGCSDESDPSGPRAASALLLPAGPSDRVLVVDGEARLLPSGTEPDAAFTDYLVAVDLPGRAPDAAVERGEPAVAALGASLIALGTERLRTGGHDDLARLVPDYVTLPRGVERERGEVAWSRGPR